MLNDYVISSGPSPTSEHTVGVIDHQTSAPHRIRRASRDYLRNSQWLFAKGRPEAYFIVTPIASGDSACGECQGL